MPYKQYGITKEQVERVKKKMKNPVVKDRVKKVLENVTKADLQNRTKVRQLVKILSKLLAEPMTPKEEEQVVSFVVDQKIDPKNTFHLIRIWGMFR